MDPLPRVSVVQDDYAIGALAARACLEAEVEEEARTFLAGLKKPAFVFCVNDEVARFLLTRAACYGHAVPEEIRFLGVDNLASPLGAPYDLISSVQLSFYSGGVRSARILDEVFGSRKAFEEQTVMIPPVGVIHRQSKARNRCTGTTRSLSRPCGSSMPRFPATG